MLHVLPLLGSLLAAPAQGTTSPASALAVLDAAASSSACIENAIALGRKDVATEVVNARTVDPIPVLLELLAPARCAEVRAAAARLLALRLGKVPASATAWRALTTAALDDPSEHVRDTTSLALQDALSCEARAPDLRVPLDEVARLSFLGVPPCARPPGESLHEPLGASSEPLATSAEAPPGADPAAFDHPVADGGGPPMAGVPPPSMAELSAHEIDDLDRPLPPPPERASEGEFWLGAALGATGYAEGPLGGVGVLAGWGLGDGLSLTAGASAALACTVCSNAGVTRADVRFDAGLQTRFFPEEDISPLLGLSVLFVDSNVTFADRHAASLQLGVEASLGVDWMLGQSFKPFVELGAFVLGEIDDSSRRAAGVIPAAPGVPSLSSEAFGLSLRAGFAFFL